MSEPKSYTPQKHIAWARRMIACGFPLGAADVAALLAEYDALLLAQQRLQQEYDELKKKEVARVVVQSQVPAIGSTAKISTGDAPTPVTSTSVSYEVDARMRDDAIRAIITTAKTASGD